MLSAVRRLRPPERSAAYANALRCGDPDERDAVVAEVLEQCRGPASTARWGQLVIAVWSDLSTQARRAVGAVLGELALPAIGHVLAHTDADARRSAVAASVAAGRGAFGESSTDLEPLLELAQRQLQDTDREVRAASAEAVAELARLGDPSDREVWHAVDLALARAASTYLEHRSQKVMMSVAWALPHAGPALSAWLTGDDQVGQLALRGSAKAVDLSASPELIVQWLALPALAGESIRRLEQITDPRDRAALMKCGHLLRLGDRARALASVRRPECLLPGAAEFAEMEGDARLGMFSWVEALPLSPAQRLRFAGMCLDDPSPAVRVRALRVLADLPASAGAAERVFEFALDTEESVAFAAAGILAEWLAQSASGGVFAASARAYLRTLCRSGHERVRDAARRAVTRTDALANPAVALQQSRRDPEGFAEHLGELIRAGDRGERLDALHVVERLGFHASVETALIEACVGEDERVAAKASKLLGRVVGARAERALFEALAHADGRVRADALEALSERSGVRADLSRFLGDEVPRVRANAIAAMLEHKPAQAREALVGMLADARSGHRLSALWAAERAGDVELAGAVSDVVRHDDDPQVRVRAARCVRTLMTRNVSQRHSVGIAS